MRFRRLIPLLVAFLLTPAYSAENAVVVELFTSEGCSSCPPADALLTQLSGKQGPNGAELIVLGEHVDYWNHSGWTDRFSSPQFTQRQQGYARRFGLASPYTPQMVIDGQRQLVGNDASGVAREITEASKQAKPAKIDLTKLANGSFEVTVRAEGHRGKVVLAVTEDGLSSQVRAGENDGRTLRHAGVVRELRTLGSLSNGSFDAKVEVPVKREWAPANLKLIVFVHQNDLGPILGACSIRLMQRESRGSTAALEPAAR